MSRRLALAASAWLVCSACSGDRDLPPAYRYLAVPANRLRAEPARQRGEVLYRNHCALCHGPRLDGQGVRQTGFIRPPRNFTDEAWQRSTSPRRIFYVISEGVPGTAMPAWRILDPDETWDLVAFITLIRASP